MMPSRLDALLAASNAVPFQLQKAALYEAPQEPRYTGLERGYKIKRYPF